VPLIIIEGLDGTGKTSLVQRLRDEYGYKIAFKTRNQDTEKLQELNINVNSYHEDVHFLNQWSSIGFNAICDRSFISAVVYGDINEKTAKIFDYCLEKIEKNKNDVFFVYLKAKDEIIIERDESWKGKQQLLQVKRYLFDNIFNKRLGDFNLLVAYTNDKSKNEVASEVIEWMNNYNL
jgi:thymidylate kinase